MNQLTLGNILEFINQLKEQGMTMEEIKKLPIFIGDDDELNGIHCGWYTNLIDADDKDPDNVYLIGMINDTLWGTKFETGKAILIS